MKKTFLTLALVSAMLAGCVENSENKHAMTTEQITVENILSRRSVRAFTGESISPEQIETLLRCAMAAPSALNKQPWAFMVVTDSVLLARIGEEMPNSRCQNKPACAFVPCGDLTKAIEGQPDFWVNDVSAATENLLLAAHAMGLGGVWTGVHPDANRVAQLQGILGLPEHIVPLCVVPVGVPAETPEVKNKFNTENIHYNRW